MKPQNQQIAIAESLGWTKIQFTSLDIGQPYGWRGNKPDGTSSGFQNLLPDYLGDLNILQGPLNRLSLAERHKYRTWLSAIVNREHRMAETIWLMITATAAQRAEAYLRTKNLWVED